MAALRRPSVMNEHKNVDWKDMRRLTLGYGKKKTAFETGGDFESATT